MPNVTVAGASGQVVTIPYDTSTNAVIAQHLAGAITAGVYTGTILPADNSAGPPPALPSGKMGEFVVSQSGMVSLPPGYSSVVVTAPQAIVFGSGDPNESILSGEGDLSFIASAGSGTVAAGGGNNLISLASGDTGAWGIYTGNGDDRILALNSGATTILAGGGNNTIQLGSGNDLITTTGNDVIQAGSGAETVGVIGSGTDLIYGNASQLTFVGGAGAATVLGGSGSDTFFGGSGSTYVVGGTAGDNMIYAGTGAATLFGGGSGDQLYAAGSAAQELHAGAGNETLFGGFASGADKFYVGSGADQITGGTGADTFVGGTGAATVQAGFGNDVFQFFKGSSGGTELVNGLYDASQVHINLQGYGANEVNYAVNHQATNGTSVTITLTDNTKVTFNDITHLNSSNFS